MACWKERTAHPCELLGDDWDGESPRSSAPAVSSPWSLADDPRDEQSPRSSAPAVSSPPWSLADDPLDAAGHHLDFDLSR